MIDVAIAKKRSKQFLLLRKQERQSGNETAKRIMISISKIIVATVSIISTLVKNLRRSTKKSLRTRTHCRGSQCLDCEVNAYYNDPNDICLIVQTLARRDRALFHDPLILGIKYCPCY
jgi:hypothetical protein